MPITLPSVSLAGASQGQTGNLNLSPASGDAGVSYATLGQQVLRLHNESQCGLQCSLNASGQSFYLPAGGWTDCYPKGGDNTLNYIILYVLANPGVTLLLATLYYPGDQIPAMPILGNSPIGGGTVSNQFNQLVNTGQPPLTSVINIQPSDASSATVTLDNVGNLLIKGDVAGVLTQLLQIVANAATDADNVVLSDSTHRAHILGGLQIEGGLTVVSSGSGIGAGPGVFINGNFNTNNGSFIIGGFTIVAKGSDTQVCAPTSTNFIRFDFPAGTTAAHVANDGYHLDGSSKYNFLVGTLSRQNGSQIACGSGTVISHGLGVTPAFVLAVCNIAQPGSATVGVGSVGSSTFTATITAGSQIDWWAASG